MVLIKAQFVTTIFLKTQKKTLVIICVLYKFVSFIFKKTHPTSLYIFFTWISFAISLFQAMIILEASHALLIVPMTKNLWFNTNIRCVEDQKSYQNVTKDKCVCEKSTVIWHRESDVY